MGRPCLRNTGVLPLEAAPVPSGLLLWVAMVVLSGSGLLVDLVRMGAVVVVSTCGGGWNDDLPLTLESLVAAAAAAAAVVGT